MDVRAHLSYLRMSPRKVRLVSQLIQGMDAIVAEQQLTVAAKHAALPLLKLLRSAIANAEHNDHLKKENLFVKSVIVNQGPTMKRFRARAFGRAAPIRKRSSHITLILSERRPTAKHSADKSHPVENVTTKSSVKTESAPLETPSTEKGKAKTTPTTRSKSLGDKIIHRSGKT